MEKEVLFSVYILVDPRTAEVRYVGRTKQLLSMRLADHLRKARHGAAGHSSRWIRQVLAEGNTPLLLVIEVTAQPHQRERFWVDHYRNAGCLLTNMTDGGEGTWGYRRPVEQIRSGEANPAAKLTWTQVRAIRAEPANLTLQEIAAKYSATVGAVQGVVTGKTWKHDPEEDGAYKSHRLPGGELRRGERNASAKLTWEQVREIRKEAQDTVLRDLAVRYQVSLPVICDIVAGRKWKDADYVPLTSRIERGLPRRPNQPRGPGSYPNRKSPAGERNSHAKLSTPQVLEIRALTGKESRRATAARYGVAESIIWGIQKGKSWKHLK